MFSSQNFWILHAQCAHKSAVGWNCIEPEATSLTIQGFTSPPCKFSCPIAVVAIPWGKLRKHPTAGGSRKNSTASARCFARNISKKMPSFSHKYGFENARKNLRPFSQIFGPGPIAGSLSQNLAPGAVFFSLTVASVELAMLPACDPGLSTECALSEISKVLQRVLVVPAWQGTLHKKKPWKKKNISWRGPAPGVEQELMSEKLLTLLGDRPCLELMIVSSDFQPLLFLQDSMQDSWSQSESHYFHLPLPELLQ